MSTTALVQYRASSLKLAANCPASLAPAGVQVDSFDPTATTGTDGHLAISLALQALPYPTLDAETEKLVELACAWVGNWLKPTYPAFAWHYEMHLAHGSLSGTMDLMGLEVEGQGANAVIVDWKATFREDDHTVQLLIYCVLLFIECPWLKSITVLIPMLRLGRAEQPRTYSREWVEAWFEEFQRNTLNHPEIYRPGEWCTRCRRKVECPALTQMMQETVEVFAADSTGKSLSRATLPALRTRVNLVKDFIKMFEDWQRETIINDGPLPLDNGKVLKAIDRNIDVIDVQKGWGIITGTFADSDLPKFITVGKTAMLKLIGDAAPRGMKGKNQDAFMLKLEEAGAVSQKKEQAIMECNP